MDSATNYARVFEQVGRIAKAQANIEGMKAENKARELRGESLAYPEESFFCEAADIDAATNYLQNFG